MSGERDDLILDLRSHAHEVPDHIGRIMRDAARELEEARAFIGTIDRFADLGVRSCPIPPPELAGKHRRPKGAMVGADGATHGSSSSCR